MKDGVRSVEVATVIAQIRDVRGKRDCARDVRNGDRIVRGRDNSQKAVTSSEPLSGLGPQASLQRSRDMLNTIVRLVGSGICRVVRRHRAYKDRGFGERQCDSR